MPACLAYIHAYIRMGLEKLLTGRRVLKNPSQGEGF